MGHIKAFYDVVRGFIPHPEMKILGGKPPNLLNCSTLFKKTSIVWPLTGYLRQNNDTHNSFFDALRWFSALKRVRIFDLIIY